jgi:hypothetical protein
MSTVHRQASFHIGDLVRIDFGRRKLTGVIVEDRGAIGAQGRHLFQVEIPMDPFEPMNVELPGDEIEPVAPETLTASSLDKRKIVNYLVNGGLISILRSNLSGGKSQPRVWLCLDQLGNITHTLVPERGVIGGQVVPFWAVQDDKVFLPERDRVLSFVESFGLSRQEAEQVVFEVGTAP